MTTITLDKPLTVRERALVDAIDRGITALRDLMEIADYSSTSVVRTHLHDLSNRGLIVLEAVANGDLTRAYSGREFCAAWDAAASLSGNRAA